MVSDFFFLEGWGELTDGAFRFLREGGMVRCCGKGVASVDGSAVHLS